MSCPAEGIPSTRRPCDGRLYAGLRRDHPPPRWTVPRCAWLLGHWQADHVARSGNRGFLGNTPGAPSQRLSADGRKALRLECVGCWGHQNTSLTSSRSPCQFMTSPGLEIAPTICCRFPATGKTCAGPGWNAGKSSTEISRKQKGCSSIGGMAPAGNLPVRPPHSSWVCLVNEKGECHGRRQ